jgi:hypothetical protein
MGELARNCVTLQLTITTASTTSPDIPLANHAGGGFAKVSGAGATITFYVSTRENGTYHQVHDSAGVAVSKTLAGANDMHPLPDEVFGWPCLRIVGDAAAVLDVALKS